MPRIRTHPGEVLQAEYLEPLQMSSSALAKQLGVPANRISDIVRQRRGMTADTALRLGRYFRTTPDFWMNLQSAHDLSKAAGTTIRASPSGPEGTWHRNQTCHPRAMPKACFQHDPEDPRINGFQV